MMRAVRFEQRFGFEIEERTRQLMNEARPWSARFRVTACAMNLT
jgi:tRNA nucleotidyltransferase/poly(A) polymerase